MRLAKTSLLAFSLLFAVLLLVSCAGESGDAELTKNTYLELVDWHISGFWVINCPVAWLRVANYNDLPIKDIVLHYVTYDHDGIKLSEGDYTVEYSVAPHSVKNFIEQYLGLVDLHSERLSVHLKSVSLGEATH